MKRAVEEYLELQEMVRCGVIQGAQMVGLLGLRYLTQLEVNVAARNTAKRAADECVRKWREQRDGSAR